MTKNSVNPLIRNAAEQIKSKRARAVIDFILKHGLVTTEDIEKMGYAHPPRAVRDVRENGIPLDTVRVKGVNGKSIAAYTFGDPAKIQGFKLGGRQTFSKQFKASLLEKQGGRCAICNEEYDDKYLQIDHRVPYELSGDSRTLDIKDFMLLCAECNRKKDRAAELGCKNTCFKTNDIEIIRSCFWASPENYTHICMEQIRRVDLAWRGDEVDAYDKLKRLAGSQNRTLQDFIKQLLDSVE